MKQLTISSEEAIQGIVNFQSVFLSSLLVSLARDGFDALTFVKAVDEGFSSYPVEGTLAGDLRETVEHLLLGTDTAPKTPPQFTIVK
jgi:hypothetical protein